MQARSKYAYILDDTLRLMRSLFPSAPRPLLHSPPLVLAAPSAPRPLLYSPLLLTVPSCLCQREHAPLLLCAPPLPQPPLLQVPP